MPDGRVLCTCDECLTEQNPTGSWIPTRWKHRHDAAQFARLADRQSNLSTRSRGLWRGRSLVRGAGRGLLNAGRGTPVRGRGLFPRARGRGITTTGRTSVRAPSPINVESSLLDTSGAIDYDYDVPMDIDSNVFLTEPSAPPENVIVHTCTPQPEVHTPQPAIPEASTSDELAVSAPEVRRSTRKRVVRVRTEVMSIKEKRALEARAAELQAAEAQPLASAEAHISNGDQEDTETDSSNDTQQIEQDLSRPSAFPTAKPRRELREIYNSSHDMWIVRIAITLVAFAHTSYNVPFRACNLILFTFNAMLLAIGMLTLQNTMPTTLQTVMARLELEDRFIVFPICAKCHRFFACAIPVDSECPDCEIPLFRPSDDFLFSRIPGRKAPAPLPELCVPMQTLSNLLTEFLWRPGMEEIVGSYWKKRPRKAGYRCDIMDGDIWQTTKGPDGRLFFDPADETEELRIGVNLGIDWYYDISFKYLLLTLY